MRPESGKIKRSRRILVNRLSQPKERKQIVGYIILCDGQSLFRDQQFGIHVEKLFDLRLWNSTSFLASLGKIAKKKSEGVRYC